ncbi:MAG: methyltransferase domain-containing protein [Chloroflexota bacterium]
MFSRDSSTLREGQYRTPKNLGARAALHRRFTVSPVEHNTWIFNYLRRYGPTEAHVLEVGCGPGGMWVAQQAAIPDNWRLNLTDASDGMVSAARAAHTQAGLDDVRYQVVDITHLPFTANSFDLVIGNYMMYHVPDIPRAVSEVARVLRPGRKFCAVTNGLTHLGELHAVVRATLPGKRFGSPRTLEDWPFVLENGKALLSEGFAFVERHNMKGHLAVTEPEPLVDYVLSTVDSGFDTYTEDEVAQLHEAFAARIAEGNGTFKISKASGMFVAWNP